MLQVTIIFILFIFLIGIIGKYLYYVAQKKKMKSDYFFDKLDKAIFKILKLNKKNMNWKEYSLALFLSNFIMMILAYVILRLQNLIFFNPNNIKDLSADLSFNTIISFMTNTNLQHYSGESALSYASQMFVITFMMFLSGASGYCACIAFLRGITSNPMGNFYEDCVRIITRVLLPIATLISLILLSQGVPQNLDSNIVIKTLEGKYQIIAMGPVATLEAIKHLGTNGGGFFSANSSMPFENPNVITNMLEILSMMILPGSCIVLFGHLIKEKTKNSKKIWIGSQARGIFIVMSIIFLVGFLICFNSEMLGNKNLLKIGLNQNMGNMEGKEVRFGILQSTLFTSVTTSFTTGSVNNMHDSLTPISGSIALLNMMLNIVFGGKGVGIMNMIVYVILTVFICGLMIGRTPEYLGKKVDSKEMKLAALCIIIHPLLILSFSAIAVSYSFATDSISNPSFHGLTQVVYEFASSAANNGSGFEGLVDNTIFWNTSTAIVMFFGRYLAMILQLAIAASMLKKFDVNESVGTLNTDSSAFTMTLLVIIIVFAALTFLPTLVLGPIAEHLMM